MKKNLTLSDKDFLKELIASNQIKKGFTFLENFTLEKELDNSLILLKKRYSELNKKNIRGTIYQKDYNIESNLIAESFLELINTTSPPEEISNQNKSKINFRIKILVVLLLLFLPFYCRKGNQNNIPSERVNISNPISSNPDHSASTKKDSKPDEKIKTKEDNSQKEKPKVSSEKKLIKKPPPKKSTFFLNNYDDPKLVTFLEEKLNRRHSMRSDVKIEFDYTNEYIKKEDSNNLYLYSGGELQLILTIRESTCKKNIGELESTRDGGQSLYIIKQDIKENMDKCIKTNYETILKSIKKCLEG